MTSEQKQKTCDMLNAAKESFGGDDYCNYIAPALITFGAVMMDTPKLMRVALMGLMVKSFEIIEEVS